VRQRHEARIEHGSRSMASTFFSGATGVGESALILVHRPRISGEAAQSIDRFPSIVKRSLA
jgi:hypothetical protein